MLPVLERGREAYCRRAWADAYTSLSEADRARLLDADDLERLATSAYLIGQEPDFQSALDRAYHLHLAAGNDARAARAAFWLGLTGLFRGETGVATGWLSRARRLVESRDCVEQGYLLLPIVEQHLRQDSVEAAHAAASASAAVGRRFGDADLITCAVHLQGRAAIQQGSIEDGLALLDEAMLAVIAGELSPLMTGLLYCSVIEVCQLVCASSRAREWTFALSRWCEQQPQLVAFTGTCLVRRAEILQFHGSWREAMAEASQACERSAQAKRKPPGAAFYQQGEIFRLRGNFAAAEEAYRSASRQGFEPQPGLALLRMAQGRTDAASAAIRRVVNLATDRFQRSKLLPAYVEIMLTAGAMQDARTGCEELESLAGQIGTEALCASAAYSRGVVELAAGDAPAAVGALRRALELWQQIEAPYAAARVRVGIGLACRLLRDEETAALEFDLARSAFAELGAAGDLDRLDALEKDETSTHRLLLTARELQVLRLVAAGKTNKSIGRELSVSERTIDRHVSNILMKLDVPSRAAATAYAKDHKLF